MDAGVDLAEFMGGAAEVLRGLLMLQVGAQPEGLTEALRTTLEGYRGRLEPGDVLRMLRLLAENEAGIRRSTSPRLMVETLLLRWAMLDRIVDLQEVLAGGQRVGGEAGRPGSRTEVRAPEDVAQGPSAPPQSTSRMASKPNSQAQPGSPPSTDLGGPADPPAGLSAYPPSLEAIRATWPAVVAAVRVHSRFLGEALAAGEPVALELPWLTVAMAEPNQLFADRLHQEAGKVEEVLSRSLGQPVRLRVTSSAGAGTPAKSRRMSDSSLKAERLREFRSQDPALDTAADALDLEIVD
jgi:DNA polymerase-3 subunit gamma/tau